MNTVEALEAIDDYYSNESKWTKGTLARDAEGKVVPMTSPHNSCMCLSGAIIMNINADSTDSVYWALIREIRKLGFTHWLLPSFNDDPLVDFGLVKEVIARAIATETELRHAAK